MTPRPCAYAHGSKKSTLHPSWQSKQLEPSQRLHLWRLHGPADDEVNRARKHRDQHTSNSHATAKTTTSAAICIHCQTKLTAIRS